MEDRATSHTAQVAMAGCSLAGLQRRLLRLEGVLSCSPATQHCVLGTVEPAGLFLHCASSQTTSDCDMNILQILSSARPSTGPQSSSSSALAEALGSQLAARHPGAQRQVRDLGRQPHPILDGAALQALFTPAEQRSPEQAARVALDDALIAELMAADVIVLAAPMYNFSVPVQLKAWIDAISRAGVTFSYNPSGPVGLVKGKTVYVVTTRGGVHRGQPFDQLVPYLRTVLGFLGMTDVHIIYAEGLAYGPDAAAKAMDDAHAQIREWANGAPAAE